MRTDEWTKLEEVGLWGVGCGVRLRRVWFLAPGFSSLPCFLGWEVATITASSCFDALLFPALKHEARWSWSKTFKTMSPKKPSFLKLVFLR